MYTSNMNETINVTNIKSNIEYFLYGVCVNTANNVTQNS